MLNLCVSRPTTITDFQGPKTNWTTCLDFERPLPRLILKITRVPPILRGCPLFWVVFLVPLGLGLAQEPVPVAVAMEGEAVEMIVEGEDDA